MAFKYAQHVVLRLQDGGQDPPAVDSTLSTAIFTNSSPHTLYIGDCSGASILVVLLNRQSTRAEMYESSLRPNTLLKRSGIKYILRAMESGDLALLTLLDLSTAFDTVDHVTLLCSLEVSNDISGTLYN
jgi:hypothetical protein